MRKIILLVIFSFLFLCACKREKRKSQNDFLLEKGLWTFIQIENDSAFNYAEIEFANNQILRIRSEFKGTVGPFDYYFKVDTLLINDFAYRLTSDNSNEKFVLENESEKFILYRIPFKEEILNKKQIDPFYLRRCYFLVHMNLITYDDAVNYLANTFEVPKDSIPEEEIIFTN
jgi:hypothetical protein